MRTAATRARRFTGAHLAAIVIGFFAVVIAVNLTMATLASRTFSGALVRNGYVASQDFDDWSAAGRRQAELGWTVAIRLEGGMLVLEARDREGAPITGAAVTAVVRHPIAADQAMKLTLNERDPGAYAAPANVARGQWQALISLKAQGQEYRLGERLYFGG